VSEKIGSLQSGYLSDQQWQWAPAAATLANLRRAVVREPGEDPTVWAVMFDGWPFRAVGDEPTEYERAAHAALTLYAIHQQSKRQKRMHQEGQSLGFAVGQLSRRVVSADATRRRFDALTTAQSFGEILHHGRGLVTQLRAADIALDYGLLARHLVQLQRPEHADRARLRWARDYYRPAAPSEDQPVTSDNTEGDQA